ncbi:MAG: dynamin family protein [Chitinispirillales bacterium]|jgi:small GTP-binding protein|nr:dynamin family protein [Chitinispirillales bacterium]
MKQTEVSFDEIIDNLVLNLETIKNEKLVSQQLQILSQIRSRLFSGEIHIAIIGQFNRGKSTFINKLIKKDLLPTSVLPLTAIPTEIRFGDETKAVISFADNSKKEAKEENVKEILSGFVTESANPENKLGVTRAEVFCNSEFLAGSTTIIDTPGFGSTHVHNTKATLAVLSQCDAVFFILSADLPITQMELNFIKQIIPQASRIFFVFNKIDLLSEADLAMTTDFVKKTLKSKLNIDVSGWFLCVSAKNETGMDVIKNEVIGFLKREKYFSLSEALERKLSISFKAIDEIVNSIKNRLNDELNSVENSFENLKKDFSENENFMKKISSVKKSWDSFSFFTPKIDKIKIITFELSDEKYSEISRRIINSLLLDNKRKTGDIFNGIQKDYTQKNAEILKKISAEKKNIREIEENQRELREKLNNIQKCINLYTQ